MRSIKNHYARMSIFAIEKMHTVHQYNLLLTKLTQIIKNERIKGFPIGLSVKLGLLNELLSKSECRLINALNPLIDRLYLVSFNLLDTKSLSSNKEKIRIANHIIECVDLIETLIKDDVPNQDALYQLKKKIHNNAFALRAPESAWKYYSLSAIDTVINGFNAARSYVFKMPYPQCHFSTHDFISQELQRFILHAEQSSTRKVLSSLLPQTNTAIAGQAEVSHLGLGHLGAAIKTLYQDTYPELSKDKKRIEAINHLLESLDEFAKQVLLAKNNEMLHTIAEKAFLASQDLVMELLTEKKPSINRIKKLTACFTQTARVIKKPGEKEEVYQLEKMVEQSDYKRCYCDKERTTYAIIHILVSVALLCLAVVEAAVFQSVSLAVSFWTISAEIGSVAVGFGQLKYYANSEIKNTLFADSMNMLSKAARLKTDEHASDINMRRKKILDGLQQSNSNLDSEVKDLLAALDNLRTHIHESRPSMIKNQALAVLRSGEDLTMDILRSPSPSLKRIKKLKECILAADKITLDPENHQAIHQLISLVSKGDYETRRIIKRDLFIGVLLALASIALYAITITGTIFSAGATSGTILSPFMLSAMAINKLVTCNRREVTLFSDNAKALTEFAQGNTSCSPGLSHCAP